MSAASSSSPTRAAARVVSSGRTRGRRSPSTWTRSASRYRSKEGRGGVGPGCVRRSDAAHSCCGVADGDSARQEGRGFHCGGGEAAGCGRGGDRTGGGREASGPNGGQAGRGLVRRRRVQGGGGGR